VTSAQQVPIEGDTAARTPDPTADVRLAWLHLRLGMLAPAAAELEELHHRGALDRDGLAALAEVRWRTGNLDAAGEAARAHRAAGGVEPIATIVAAEAAAAAGDVATARQLVDGLRRLDAATLDALFAGMPRKASWPAAPSEPAPVSSTAARSSGPATAAEPGAGLGVGGAGSAPVTGQGPTNATRSVPGPSEVMALTPELWPAGSGSEPEAASTGAGGGTAAAGSPAARATRAGPGSPVIPAGRWVEPARPRGHADPDAELQLAREELDGAPERGLLRLALVLRLDPTLAPDVLDALRLRREPLAALLRGDAERLVGRHLEAEAAFADAAESIERDALASRPGTRHHMAPGQPPDRAPGDHPDDPHHQEPS
jgi:hypothetical protein